MSANLNDIMRRVQALITQADHPNTGPAEAETFRAKAEALMFKYRIDESNLSAAEKTAMALSVQWATIDVCDATSEFRSFYVNMLGSCVAHLDIRQDYIQVDYTNGYRYTCDIVGYESDLAFVQSLFASAKLAFGKLLEPRYDPELSDQVNAYLMRSAGMEGHRIAMAIYGKDDKSLRPKVRKMFAAEATLRGEDPAALLGRGSNMKLFRESYASGFVSEFSLRLSRMRQARAQHEQGLVLAGRKAAIDEAYYERHPDRRPTPRPAIGQADTTKCAKCAKAQSGYCRDHAWMRPRKGRVRYANSEALSRGRSAARSVDLGITGRSLS